MKPQINADERADTKGHAALGPSKSASARWLSGCPAMKRTEVQRPRFCRSHLRSICRSSARLKIPRPNASTLSLRLRCAVTASPILAYRCPSPPCCGQMLVDRPCRRFVLRGRTEMDFRSAAKNASRRRSIDREAEAFQQPAEPSLADRLSPKASAWHPVCWRVQTRFARRALTIGVRVTCNELRPGGSSEAAIANYSIATRAYLDRFAKPCQLRDPRMYGLGGRRRRTACVACLVKVPLSPDQPMNDHRLSSARSPSSARRFRERRRARRSYRTAAYRRMNPPMDGRCGAWRWAGLREGWLQLRSTASAGGAAHPDTYNYWHGYGFCRHGAVKLRLELRSELLRFLVVGASVGVGCGALCRRLCDWGGISPILGQADGLHRSARPAS